MTNPLMMIRERFHPLFHLRKISAFRWAASQIDIPLAIRVKPVKHPVYVSLAKNMSLVLSGGEAGEEQERKHFIDLVKSSGFRRFFDVGANIGLYGFIFRSIADDAEVTMIEPDADNGALISRTIARAGIRNINLIQAAASDEVGTLTFYKDNVSGSTGSLRYGANNDAFVTRYQGHKPTSVTVGAISLDKLCADPDQDPDLMKVDVEGAELSVFRGAVNLLSRSQPALFFECDIDQSTIQSFLAERGYQFFDFSSMDAVDTVVHNCLALHSVKHRMLIDKIHQGAFGSGSILASSTPEMTKH